MKKLLILSGKGGTGKTTVACAFIKLSRCLAFGDCDVDAPNLHLVAGGFSEPQKIDYYGFEKAFIDKDKCIRCGLCREKCAFGAIKDFSVGEFECEGCVVCAEICPASAISMKEHISGDMLLYRDDERVFSTAKLKMGSGASGKLVTAVKQQLADNAPEAPFVIMDGSPGIGCPVIASINGVDFVLIVAEPTISGMHDMRRIIDTCGHFRVKCAVCINKFDVNPDAAAEIEGYCAGLSVPVLGRIPYDSTVVKAVNRLQSISDYPESLAGRAIARIWDEVKTCIQEDES